MHTAQTILIPARDVRKGATLVDKAGTVRMQVLRVCECGDGSLRFVTDRGEQRMTGSIPVRVLH